MTFEEAFNSGFRFRNTEWTKSIHSIYWIKVNETQVKIIEEGKNSNIYTITPSIKTFKYWGYPGHEEYELHPDDEFKMKFNNKLEDIINA